MQSGAKEIDDILKKLNPVEHLRHVVEQERRQESTDFSVNLNYWDFEFSELARLEETEKEDTKFEELYKKCVDYVGRSPDVKLNTAQIAASLTKSTIQSNTDQFVVRFRIKKKSYPLCLLHRFYSWPNFGIIRNEIFNYPIYLL